MTCNNRNVSVGESDDGLALSLHCGMALCCMTFGIKQDIFILKATLMWSQEYIWNALTPANSKILCGCVYVFCRRTVSWLSIRNLGWVGDQRGRSVASGPARYTVTGHLYSLQTFHIMSCIMQKLSLERENIQFLQLLWSRSFTVRCLESYCILISYVAVRQFVSSFCDDCESVCV